MNELDKWSAEACGVEHHIVKDTALGSFIMWNRGKGTPSIGWTLSDARCMEIFREKFAVTTIRTSKAWCADARGTEIMEGKTIKEAELACARTLMASRIKSS